MTRIGRTLQTDAPCSMRAWTLQWGGEAWRVWANLLHSVKTGRARAHCSRVTPASHTWSAIRRRAQIFNQAMVDLTRLAAMDIARAYDFAGKQVMDVGGGYGELLAQILLTHPSARGVLFDMPHAISRAREHLGGRNLEGRCEFVAGDFFAGIPSGSDVYIMKTVIHDWADDRARDILRTCRSAMTPGARLLIIERLMPERLEPSAQNRGLARVDLHMLVALGAQERTQAADGNPAAGGGPGDAAADRDGLRVPDSGSLSASLSRAAAGTGTTGTGPHNRPGYPDSADVRPR